MTMTDVASVKFIRRSRLSELQTERNNVTANIWVQTVRSLEHPGLRSLILFGSVIIYVLLTKHCAFLFDVQTIPVRLVDGHKSHHVAKWRMNP